MAMPARWPDWWTWELDLDNPHLAKRMFDRGFTEIDLRGMLQAATGYLEDPAPDRWRIETKHFARPWIVIVEPQYDEQRLLVITAFPIG